MSFFEIALFCLAIVCIGTAAVLFVSIKKFSALQQKYINQINQLTDKVQHLTQCVDDNAEKY